MEASSRADPPSRVHRSLELVAERADHAFERRVREEHRGSLRRRVEPPRVAVGSAPAHGRAGQTCGRAAWRPSSSTTSAPRARSMRCMPASARRRRRCASFSPGCRSSSRRRPRQHGEVSSNDRENLQRIRSSAGCLASRKAKLPMYSAPSAKLRLAGKSSGSPDTSGVTWPSRSTRTSLFR
jgi:hypothetical protein